MSTLSLSPSSPDWSMLALADRDPFAANDVMRERGPVIWDPGMKCWLVLSYDVALQEGQPRRRARRCSREEERRHLRVARGGERGFRALRLPPPGRPGAQARQQPPRVQCGPENLRRHAPGQAGEAGDHEGAHRALSGSPARSVESVATFHGLLPSLVQPLERAVLIVRSGMESSG